MVWIALIVAGLLEVVGALALKCSRGFTHIAWGLAAIVAWAASFYLLSWAAEILPIGTAYAIWTGIGSAGTALAGMIVLNEARNLGRVVSLCLVICGSIGMKVFQ